MHLLLWIKVLPVFDVMCMGFIELWETGRERKIQNEDLYINQYSN